VSYGALGSPRAQRAAFRLSGPGRIWPILAGYKNLFRKFLVSESPRPFSHFRWPVLAGSGRSARREAAICGQAIGEDLPARRRHRAKVQFRKIVISILIVILIGTEKTRIGSIQGRCVDSRVLCPTVSKCADPPQGSIQFEDLHAVRSCVFGICKDA
jgi:hypothetical protein